MYLKRIIECRLEAIAEHEKLLLSEIEFAEKRIAEANGKLDKLGKEKDELKQNL